LAALAEAVVQRLGEAGVNHTFRFIEPTEVSSWQFVVDVDEGSVDLIFGTHASDKVAVIFDYQQEISLPLATEFVAMSVGLITEEQWLAMRKDEVEADQEASRRARRDRWKARLRMHG
jgi:hypothetical protein